LAPFGLKGISYVSAWCFKKSFTTLKAYIHLFRGHAQYLNCHNVAKHTEFYLR
jgi:hypothetical protein